MNDRHQAERVAALMLRTAEQLKTHDLSPGTIGRGMIAAGIELWQAEIGPEQVTVQLARLLQGYADKAGIDFNDLPTTQNN